MGLYRGLHLAGLGLTSDEARGRRAQIPRTRIQCPQRRKVRAQAVGLDLEHLDRSREIPQPPRPQVDEINAAEHTRRRVGQEDLPAVTGGHHACGAIQNRSEVVALTQLGLAGRQPHPHRQFECPLRGHRRIDRRSRRGERGAHTVAGVFEQPAAVRLDRLAQRLVVCREGDPHPVRVGFPPTRRTLDIGEQKRHDT
jgi:hypothetical protein